METAEFQPQNSVFIGCSLDGFIAYRNDALDWLDTVPNPEKEDGGYHSFMNRIDALVMGRRTFEVVLGFGEWPYSKPVFVLSNSIKEVPVHLRGKAELLNGSLKEVLNTLHRKGFKRLYIDGGQTVQAFLNEDLIDELIITRLPVVLGDGVPLFGMLKDMLWFEHKSTRVYSGHLVQSHYARKRS
jgi:dihydrofolate reductase